MWSDILNVTFLPMKSNHNLMAPVCAGSSLTAWHIREESGVTALSGGGSEHVWISAVTLSKNKSLCSWGKYVQRNSVTLSKNVSLCSEIQSNLFIQISASSDWQFHTLYTLFHILDHGQLYGFYCRQCHNTQLVYEEGYFCLANSRQQSITRNLQVPVTLTCHPSSIACRTTQISSFHNVIKL